MLAQLSVLAAVSVGKIDRALIVERFMDGKAARIGMMAAEIASRRGTEAERQVRAGRTLEDDRREHTSLDAAVDRRTIGRIEQPLRCQVCDDLVLLGLGDERAMAHAGVTVEERIQGDSTKIVVPDLPGVVLEQI